VPLFVNPEDYSLVLFERLNGNAKGDELQNVEVHQPKERLLKERVEQVRTKNVDVE
jgi:hypothetical protein